MQDRGLAAYIAELIGTYFLVFFITSAVTLFVAVGNSAQFGSDFAVIGLVHAFLLFGLIVMFGAVSGGHFNPAVTFAATLLRRIEPIDGLIYILAQLSGAVAGAFTTKALLLDEGRAGHYGSLKVSGLLANAFAGSVVEALGTFVLVLVILVAVFSERGAKDWAPFAIGAALGLAVMVGGPLTGGGFNPARWFGPALVANSFNGFAGIWPYIVGPLVGAGLAAAVFAFVVEPAPATAPAPKATRTKA